MNPSIRPIVSVIMPAYNSSAFITDAISSVCNQTFTDWELIIIDDGSNDDTPQKIETIAKKDCRIRFYKNDKNIGVAKTRNRGFDLCRGKYVALLDSDDVWYPDKLEKQIELLEKTGVDIIYCSYGIIGESGKKICDDFIVPETTDFDNSLIKSVISCSTVLFSENITKKYRFGSEYYHEDLVLWLILLRDGYKALGVTEVLAEYRVIQGSRASNKVRSAVDRWRIYRYYLKMPMFKCTVLLFEYIVMGLKKYRKKHTKHT